MACERELERLQDQFLVGAEVPRELGGGRRARQPCGQDVASALEAQRQLLKDARDAQRPGAVAEVPAELAQDRRDGEAGERGAEIGRASCRERV